MEKPSIAIMGANSHIAKGLISSFLADGDARLHLFTRNASSTISFLKLLGRKPDACCLVHDGYANFRRETYDLIVNCVGAGTLKKLNGDYSSWFTLTEEFDNLAISYLRDVAPEALYISLSSGSVYGRDCSAPFERGSVNQIPVNGVGVESYYSIARLNAEAKHRSFKGLRIVDLRIFSYFSRFADLSDGYFMSDLLSALLQGRPLLTDKSDFVRDYAGPDELISVIRRCLASGPLNAAFDMLSLSPVSKSELLGFFSSERGLKYEMADSLGQLSATGAKKVYCSSYNKLSEIGYAPQSSSLDIVSREAKLILERESHE